MKLWKRKRFWGGLIAIALLVFCVKDVRLEELRTLCQRLELVFFLPALGFTFLFVVGKGLRWRLLISQHKLVPRLRVIPLYAAGQFLNIAMPALTGQVGRMILFAKRENLSKTFVFSSILLEIVFDAISLVVILLLTSLAFVFPDEYRYVSIALGAVTVTAIILMYVLLTFQTRLEEFGRRRLRERWPGLYIVVKKAIRSFAKGIETLKSSQHILGSLLYSLVLWISHAMVIYFMLRAFGYRLPLAAAASVMIINTLALLVPITPGNAGTFELAVSASLAAFSVGRSDAVLFAVGLHLLDLLPLVTLGVAFLRSEKVSIRQFETEHGDVTILDQVSEEGVLVDKEEGA